MLKKIFPIITATFFLFCNPAPSQGENTNKTVAIADTIVSSALNERAGYEWLRELCEIGPRLSGSENLDKAVNWTTSKIKSLGFEPWLQPVMVPHWVRGSIESAEITQSKLFKGKKLNIAALGRTISTPDEGITAEVLEVKSFAELKQRKNEVKGKIVFFSRPFNQSFINTFTGYSDDVNQRSEGAIEAAKYGGVAAIIRSVTTKYDNVPHTGAMKNYVDSLPKVPGAALGYNDADYLSDALIKDPHLKLTLKLNSKTLPDVQSYNIITDIKGTEFPDEVIVIGGHLDSWDKGEGAQDDGGGCMQALEVLDLFKRLSIHPKRTIRCIFFANEENGNAGGIKYGKYSDTTSLKHIAAIESDRGVFTPRGFTVDTDSVNHPETMQKLRSWLPILKKANIDWFEEGGSGSDVGNIKKAKVLFGFVPDSQRYFDLHHSANDIFEEVHPREMELGTAAIAILVYLISEQGL